MEHRQESAGTSAPSDNGAGNRAKRAPDLVVVRGPLSFQTTIRTRRGTYVSQCDFDVPAEGYEEGWLTGIAAAAELMDALKRGQHSIDLLEVMRDAARPLQDDLGRPPFGPSRRGAACGFLSMIARVISWARAWDHSTGFRTEADHIRQSLQERKARAEARKVEFVHRMRAAREAKKARGARHG